jgi:glycosyltransferase involved in cell wall biosynthesis
MRLLNNENYTWQKCWKDFGVYKIMIIHFFTKGDRSAGSSRQRAFLVAEELNKRNVQSIVHQPPLVLVSKTPWPQKIKLIWRYLKIFRNIKKEDIIFLQRAIYNKYFFILIVFYRLVFRRKMIFDFDDAIYLHSFFKTKTLTKLADAVIVGSHSLADWVKKYNKNVFIIPTSVSFLLYDKYNRFKRAENEKFTIGWIGNGPAHYENLKILVPVFEKLIKEGLKFKFILVGSLGNSKVYDLFRGIKTLDIEFIDALDWSNSEAIPKMIQNFDIGLMPLIDTEWNRGKCAFKAIEYMACGLPAIISPVGENNYLIKDGENGFLAFSIEDWAEKMKKIYNNPALLVQLGKKAQETILKNYSFEANIPIIQAIIKKL